MKKLTLTILFLPVLLFSQDKNIPVEVKNPDAVYGEKNENLQFYKPGFIAYNPYDKNVYIVDRGNNRIIIIDENGRYVGEFGRKGQGPVEFNRPESVAFCKNGDILISDDGNARIQILDRDYNYINGFKTRHLGFMSPNIAVDEDFRIYLLKADDVSLMGVFDKKGKEIHGFGKAVKTEPKKLIGFINTFAFLLDNNGDLYGAFLDFPLIRKYNKNFQLEYEINYEFIPEAKSRSDKFKKNKKTNKNGNLSYTSKSYITSLTVDEKFIYVVFNSQNSVPVYLFSKENGDIIKKIMLQFKEIPEYPKIKITTSPDYIFAVDPDNMLIYRYNK